MRWSEAVTLEFVKIYLKHECLWNPSHPGYKLRYQREQAYSDISAEFKSSTMKSLTVPEIKMKIKNLRTTYVQQVHKILQKSSPDSIYEPSLVWFHEMDRCLKHIPSNRHSNSYTTSQEAPDVDSACQIWVDQELQNTNMDEVNPDPLIPQTDDEYDSAKLDEQPSKVKIERRSSPVYYKKIKKKKLKHRATPRNYSTDSVPQCTKEDEFDIYVLLINVVKMRWSENETYQFVKIYLSHELLWNPEHAAYRLKSKRLKAYREIIAELNETTGILLNETELKIKIKNLRSTYMQEIAKIKHRSGPEWSYKPNMKWFSEWHKHFGGLKKASDDSSTFDSQQDSLDDANQKIWLSSTDNMEEETLEPFPEDDEYTLILKTEPREVPQISESRYQNKKKKIKHRRPSTDCSERTFVDTIDSNIDTAKEDEFDIYGKYIASQLRKMDLQKALRVQLEIQSLVSEARLSGLNGKH
ncbi:hypothetical protein HW555_002732 [Spodoptera exigua]|uniref:MADF domain-containing protein n=1 Tax=Spodoptera exigua TaxID=7107 RepID=A0A835GLJ2_SPOEX|nr:hypothetical protein HW555_002732 [Spodoptera exigua]